MNQDPGVLCFQHCKHKVFGFNLPDSCPICSKDLNTEPLQLPPFRIPYPFVRASQNPCSLVIKPTRGDFLHDYRNTADLHIGITNSESIVYEYDHEGLHTDYTSSWSQCLAVPIIHDHRGELDPVWREYWDFTLHTTARQEQWTEERYDEHNFNCYSFILDFLSALRPPKLSMVDLTATSVCSQLIVPYTSTAAKYISLYRKIVKHNFFIVEK